jgi:hypothetical protein
MDLSPGRYFLEWSLEGEGGLFSIKDESEGEGGRYLVPPDSANLRSQGIVIRLNEGGRHRLSVEADNLDWKFAFTPEPDLTGII